MLQVTLARLEPLSPLTYWYLDEQEDDPIMALTMPIQAATRRQLFNQMTKISKRINDHRHASHAKGIRGQIF
jgi:mannitol/fructose-specific phosphotransferase system IIA component (Ntr-type)